jgi:hypothetical protein
VALPAYGSGHGRRGGGGANAGVDDPSPVNCADVVARRA